MKTAVLNARKLAVWTALLSSCGAACGPRPPSVVSEPRTPATAVSSSSSSSSTAKPRPNAAPSAVPREPDCPAIQTYPITLVVYDGKSGQQICDADITVTDVSDGRSVQVQRNPATCRTQALDAWNGDFTVKATRSGFEAAEEHAQVVTTRCGYENTQVTLWLEPVLVGGKEDGRKR